MKVVWNAKRSRFTNHYINAPTCMQKLFKPAVNTKYNILNKDKKFFLCYPWTLVKRALAHNIAKPWNDLPGSMKQAMNISAFKREPSPARALPEVSFLHMYKVHRMSFLGYYF